MGYPFSISKTVNIQGEESSQLLRFFKAELHQIDGIKFVTKANKIELTECIEFSSGLLRINHLNRGYIIFQHDNGTTKIKGEIYLIEHTILFLIVALFCVIGILNYTPTLTEIGITSILLLTIFVYCYLIPMMSFYSFFNNTIKLSAESTNQR